MPFNPAVLNPDLKLIIFDADGTLRRCKDPTKICPNTPDEQELIPGVQEALAWFETPASPQVEMAVVSNQGGVGLGYMTQEMAIACVQRMCEELWPRERTSRDVMCQLCPHAPTAGCLCRKPNPYMLFRAIFELVHTRGVEFDLQKQVLFVGDLRSDEEAAARAGIPFRWAYDFFGMPSHLHCTIEQECERFRRYGVPGR